MHLESLAIKNFKLFRDVRLHFDPAVNVLTGANNSGKTTVLEALALWGECFIHLLHTAGRSDPGLKLRAGDLRLGGSQPTYLAQTEFRSVRNHGESDLFHRLDSRLVIELDARIASPLSTIDLGFSLRMGRGGLIDLRSLRHDRLDYESFNALFRGSDPLRVLFASPVAALLFREDFETLPKIRRRVRARESMLVLRNRIYQLRKRPEAYQDFLRLCSLVLCGRPGEFELEISGNETESVELHVTARTGADRQARDISLLGSGALQVLELVLALCSERGDLTLILLDEPDSHIHRDIQRRLMDALRQAPDCQLFLTTHNEGLIRNSRPEQLYHLDGVADGDLHPITRHPVAGIRAGLQPSPHRKVLQSLGSETALDFVNALEADRLVLVEGEDDARHIHAIADMQRLQPTPFRGMYWAFGGIDEIFINIDVYQRIFQSFKNGGTLWDKAVLVFDRDVLTDEMREKLIEQLRARLQIPVFIWESYTLEATLLSEPDKLVDLLTNTLVRRARESGIGATAIDRDVVARTLEREIARHAESWRDMLQNSNHPDWLAKKVEIFNRLRDRRRHIDENPALRRKVRALEVPDAELEPRFTQYALRRLGQGRIDHLTGKDEVHEILRAVAAAAGGQLDDPRWFEEIVQTPALPASWISQWQELQRLLR
jgi:hypothetical protein